MECGLRAESAHVGDDRIAVLHGHKRTIGSATFRPQEARAIVGAERGLRAGTGEGNLHRHSRFLA